MDSLFRHIHPLDAFEAEQELDLVDGRVRGHLLQDRPERLLNILAERDALDDEAGQVHGHSLVRLKHEPSGSGFLSGVVVLVAMVAGSWQSVTTSRKRRICL